MRDTTRARYQDSTVCSAVYRYLLCRSYPSRVRDTVTTSAVTSAGYELALGGSQTCNIWLPVNKIHYWHETSARAGKSHHFESRVESSNHRSKFHALMEWNREAL